jgi:hypothetical protein
MERFLKDLNPAEYHKNRGRVAEIDDFSATLEIALKQVRADEDDDEQNTDG